MKRVLLYIFAIPIGLIASFILPTIFSKIFDYFIPFDAINNFLDTYLITALAGWIAVGISALVAPSKRILFASIMLILNIIATVYMFQKGDNFNYMFIIGGILALILITYGELNKEKLFDSYG